MKPEELQAIRERYENATHGYLESSVIESHQDVPKLLDEVERQTDRAEDLLDQLTECHKSLANVEAEIERLRGALGRYARNCEHCLGRGTIRRRTTTTQPEMECLTCKWARQALAVNPNES